VLISGTITGSDGSQSQSGNRAWATNLLSNQKAPFYIEFLPPNGGSWYGIDITDIALNVYQAPTTAEHQYPKITIINHQAAPTATGEYWVKGQIQNVGNQTATGISMFATFYNSEGTPVATGYTDPIATLAAGSTINFKVAAFDLNQTIVPADKKIVSYSLLVQLKSPMLSGNAPVSTTSATSPPNKQPNADADQTILYAAAGAIAIIAGVTTLVLLRRRKLKQPSRSKLMKPVNPSKKAKRNKK